MKWLFERVERLSELEVVVRKESFDSEVQELLDYLEVFGQGKRILFPSRRQTVFSCCR